VQFSMRAIVEARHRISQILNWYIYHLDWQRRSQAFFQPYETLF